MYIRNILVAAVRFLNNDFDLNRFKYKLKTKYIQSIKNEEIMYKKFKSDVLKIFDMFLKML